VKRPRCQGQGTITTLRQILLRSAGQRPPSPLVGGRHQALQQVEMRCLVLGSTTGVLIADNSTHNMWHNMTTLLAWSAAEKYVIMP